MKMCKRSTEKETLESSTCPWNRINATLTASALWYKMFYYKGCQANSPMIHPTPHILAQKSAKKDSNKDGPRPQRCVPQSRHEKLDNTAKVWSLSGDQLKLIFQISKSFWVTAQHTQEN